MNTPTHTPGPWFAIPGPSFDLREIGRSAAFDPLPIATVRPVATHSTPQTDAEMVANARLIAAAPELLAALIACEAKLTAVCRAFYVDGKPAALRAASADWIKVAEPARAAIAKATP